MIIDKCPFCENNLVESKLRYSLNKQCKNCLFNLYYIDNKLNSICVIYTHNNYSFYQKISFSNKKYEFISYYKKEVNENSFYDYDNPYEIEKSDKKYLRGFTKKYFTEFKEALDNISAVRMIFN